MEASALTVVGENLERLLTSLNAPERHLVVALSGGVDSVCLLLAAQSFCAQSEYTLSACHVHHGLSPHADTWLSHCQALCRKLRVPFHSEHVTLEQRPRQSLEAVAREARYLSLVHYCKSDDGILLLGHHLHDQLETVLLQLKRGSGPKGLAGMGESQLRDGVRMLRPMLTLDQTAIEQAVRQSGFTWVDDESNSDDRFDRNFLRNQVLPLLLKRWPQMTQTVSRSAQLCAEQDAMVEEVASARLQAMLGREQQIVLNPFRRESERWQRAILRVWLGQQGVDVPGLAQLEQVRHMQHARQDAQPCVKLGEYNIRRFNDALFIVAPAMAPPDDPLPIKSNTFTALPWLGISVSVRGAQGADIDNCYVQTGMPPLRVKPVGEQMTKPLKQWLKLWDIPVWERPAVAVLFISKTPAALITRNSVTVLSPFEGELNIERKTL